MAERIWITGRVQGVGFRAFTESRARALGVAGWVRNLPDGRVEAHLEGDAEVIGQLIATLREGPRFGRVDDLRRETVADEGNSRFEIHR